LASRSAKAADDAGRKAQRGSKKVKRRERSRSRRRRRTPSPREAASVSASGEDRSEEKGSFTLKRSHFRRLAVEKPGRLLEQTLTQYREQLSSGFGDAHDEKLPPIIVSYLLAAWLPQNQRLLDDERFGEVRTLAEAIDLGLRGRTPEVLDVLAQRFKACLLSARDGHTRASRWLELIPTDSAGSGVSANEEEIARKLESEDLKLKALVTKTRSG